VTPTLDPVGGRPPRGVVLRYRLLGRRPDGAYDAWLRTDLDGRGFPVRAGVHGAVVPTVAVLVGWWAASALGWRNPPDLVGAGVVYVVLAVVEGVRAAVRRESIREHLFGDRREVGHFQPYVHLDEGR
jgi:hypothetical protein